MQSHREPRFRAIWVSDRNLCRDALSLPLHLGDHWELPLRGSPHSAQVFSAPRYSNRKNGNALKTATTFSRSIRGRWNCQIAGWVICLRRSGVQGEESFISQLQKAGLA